ncbi:MAG: phosphoribosylformylglycinamidine synthase, partial [Lachnospiraceae bacterium]|nr:phosphoribosylformylglycinamidine synthase [Lachnospiraceae bacterium]
DEEWLINFKNETHNHPTEIEPFGGAATCLGGAIRDPLSGRTYVYQAMRITGAADPTRPQSETLHGKLPQKKIVRDAAKGYSSYGNQIGLATGYVKELYHPDYVAKRMEIGAVMGAAPRRAVMRETSRPGDVIILLGGETGRDGIGGATGSSKVHTEASIEVCGAEVQKGNAPTERKLQRLFRREEVSILIRKCNDFGAGGVSVAIGELADGLEIELDAVPKKYAGLDGTEIAISESQERMAVVVAPEDVDAFMAFAKEENLAATVVAHVTEDPRLVMHWRGNEIVNLSRAFMNTNGAHQEAKIAVDLPVRADCMIGKKEPVENVREKWLNTLADLNVCSQRGLVERFDASIGAGSVLMPYGGKYQLTETQAMVAKVPVANGDTTTVTMMSYGFDPYLSSWSPYHGSAWAVTSSVAKIVAAGGDYSKIRFTFQEYFRRMTEDPHRWSQPFAALLGAYKAQIGFGLPSIGGKDSMSGTFEHIDVPPTLVSFAVDVAKEKDVVTPELKKAGNQLVVLHAAADGDSMPDFETIKKQYAFLHEDMQAGNVVSAYVTDRFGIAPAVTKMAFGNGLGVAFEENVKAEDLFVPQFGDIVCEVKENAFAALKGEYELLGTVIPEAEIRVGGEIISLEEAKKTWEQPLEKVFKSVASEDSSVLETPFYKDGPVYVCKNKIAKPRVFIPVFPGTNCEYDSRRAFEAAGAEVETCVFRNMTSEDIRESVDAFAQHIANAQIIMFPGGFSAGDEPEGSAKFFATAFQNAKIKDAVMKLLNERDGLILGICNGFQALIKLGLVPYGEICGQQPDSPTLTFNTIGRHISRMVYTKIVSNKSPWLAGVNPGDVIASPASHGEGRFVAPQEWIDRLFANGQVATQYCDPDGIVTMDDTGNVNGSYASIEGITSPDGRIFGKMAHIERRGRGVAVNIFGEQDMKVFVSGVKYFR